MKDPMKSYISQLLFLVTLLLVTGCKTVRTNGHIIDSSVIESIKNNKSTKEQVLDLVGTPEVISEITPNTWYYVQRTVSSRLWFQPKVLEQKIVKVVFNNHDVVTNVSFINDCNIEDLKLVSDYTKTKGKDVNAIQTWVRNFGRFNKKPAKKNKI